MGHFEDSVHPTVLHLLLLTKERASARIVYSQTDSGPWPSLPRCILLWVLHIRKGRNGKALKRWSDIERETHLQRASTVGVDDSFALSPEQVRYPIGEFGSKTLGITVHELMDADPLAK